jgi:hypothetical protein
MKVTCLIPKQDVPQEIQETSSNEESEIEESLPVPSPLSPIATDQQQPFKNNTVHYDDN